MNKKILFSFIGLFLLVGLATAGIISSELREKEISPSELTKLQSVNSETFSYSPLKCDSSGCDDIKIESGYARTEFKPRRYKQVCIEWENEGEGDDRGECLNYNQIAFTNAELTEQIDAQINETKERVLTRIALNEERERTEVLSSGEVEFKSGVIRK